MLRYFKHTVIIDPPQSEGVLYALGSLLTLRPLKISDGSEGGAGGYLAVLVVLDIGSANALAKGRYESNGAAMRSSIAGLHTRPANISIKLNDEIVMGKIVYV